MTTTPIANKTVPSAAIRKTATTGPRKAVLGGKSKQKLGAKKITGGDTIDFEAAEKKAKEEAERIEKLGYDPEAEEAATKETKPKIAGVSAEKTAIASPTPLSPGKVGFGTTKGRERSASELERLGMGMGRLGFGQVGGAKPAAVAPKKMGFGAVSKPVAEGENSYPKLTALY